jgi:hypothetical protein
MSGILWGKKPVSGPTSRLQEKQAALRQQALLANKVVMQLQNRPDETTKEVKDKLDNYAEILSSIILSIKDGYYDNDTDLKIASDKVEYIRRTLVDEHSGGGYRRRKSVHRRSTRKSNRNNRKTHKSRRH